MTRARVLAAGVTWLLLISTSAAGQGLDPRAYAQAPTGLTVAIAGVSFSSGEVLTDPTLPAENVHADVSMPSVGVARTFSLFGRTAQGLAALPYSWAQATGDVGVQTRRIDRSGLTDMRVRLSNRTLQKDKMRSRLLATMTVGIVMLLTTTVARAQTPAEPATGAGDGWKTIIYPVHAWLPVFGADITLPGQPAPPGSGDGSGGITIPSAKTSGNFDGAALAGFRVERARLSIEGEALWAGMTGSVEAPRFDLSLDTIAFRLLGGFEVAPALYIDGGVRRFAVNMAASVLDFHPVTWKPGIWEPVVGATFRPRVSKSLRLFTQTNVGFAADDSNRSVAAIASVEWKPLSHLSLGGGWGWMYLRADGTISTDKAVHFSQTLNGPQLTIGIPF